MTKAVNAKVGEQGWTINRAALIATSTGADDEKSFNFGLEINFFADKVPEPEVETLGKIGEKISDNDKLKMGDWIHIQVKETSASDLFKFVTKKCWFTARRGDRDEVKDEFFKDYCPISTNPAYDDFKEKTKSDSKFEMKVSTLDLLSY